MISHSNTLDAEEQQHPSTAFRGSSNEEEAVENLGLGTIQVQGDARYASLAVLEGEAPPPAASPPAAAPAVASSPAVSPPAEFADAGIDEGLAENTPDDLEEGAANSKMPEMIGGDEAPIPLDHAAVASDDSNENAKMPGKKIEITDEDIEAPGHPTQLPADLGDEFIHNDANRQGKIGEITGDDIEAPAHPTQLDGK